MQKKTIDPEVISVPTDHLLTLIRECFVEETFVPDMEGDDTAEDDLKRLIYRGKCDDVERIDNDDGSVTLAFMGRGTVAVVEDYDPGDYWNPPAVSRRDVEAAWSIEFTLDEDGYATAEGRADIHP